MIEFYNNKKTKENKTVGVNLLLQSWKGQIRVCSIMLQAFTEKNPKQQKIVSAAQKSKTVSILHPFPYK